MLAGTSTIRTIVASTMIATASPKPTCWKVTRSLEAIPAKTATMISAAPVMMLAVWRRPYSTDGPVLAGLVVALLDAAKQEDVVVHGEAEENREEEQRQPGLDHGSFLEAQKACADAILEDQHQQAVGRADGQQVHDDGLERHDDRAEDHQQEQEAQAEDEGEDVRQVVLLCSARSRRSRRLVRQRRPWPCCREKAAGM